MPKIVYEWKLLSEIKEGDIVTTATHKDLLVIGTKINNNPIVSYEIFVKENGKKKVWKFYLNTSLLCRRTSSKVKPVKKKTNSFLEDARTQLKNAKKISR